MSPIALRNIRVPLDGDLANVRFSSWVRACSHICDHVLTPPEMNVWTWFLPELRPLIEASRARYRLGLGIWLTEGRSALRMLDSWLGLVERSVKDAIDLGWVFADGRDRLFFCPRGILTVIGRYGRLRTSYVPLPAVQVADEKTTGTENDEEILALRRRDPFPRAGRYRLKTPLSPAPDGDDSLDLQTRFLIFRRASSRVRGNFARALRESGERDSPALACLRRARRDFDAWRELTCGSGEDEL